MTDENKKARKEAKNKIKKKNFFKSIETRKENIIACIFEYLILVCTCIFSSSQLNTLIISFAFDFVFVKFFYNTVKSTNHKRIINEIDHYNQKIENDPKSKLSFLCFDEEYFEKRSNITINALRLFIYCTCIIPAFIYDGFTTKDGDKYLKLEITKKIYHSISEFFIKHGKELFTLASLIVGSIIFIIIIIIYSKIDNASETYDEKYNAFKDIRSPFEKEDFLFLKIDEEKNKVKNGDNKETKSPK